MRFNGAANHFQVIGPTGQPTGDAPVTVAAVVWPVLPLTGKVVHFGSNLGGTDESAFLSANGSNWTFGSFGGNSGSSFTPPGDTVWAILTGVYNGPAGTWRIYVNGVLEDGKAEVPPYPNYAADRLVIGADNALASEYFSGNIAEIVLYDHALSGPQIDALNAYFSAKYAIPLP